MSGVYVTPDGFIGKTFEENKLYWETAFQGVFGNDIDLDPEGPFGQLVGLFAKRDTDLWEAAAEIYNSRDPDQATGVSLDSIASETGIIRIAAGKTSVSSVLLFGTSGTLIPAGSQAKQSTGEFSNINYNLTANVTLSPTIARYAELTVGVPSVSEVFTITIDGTPYSHTAAGGEDETDVADALVALIDAGSFEGTISNVGEVITILQESEDFNLTFTSNITLGVVASAGTFEAETAGAFSCPANTLNEIVTPVSGWDSVNNLSAGITGREIETDEELRIRRANTAITGKATEDAIAVDISNTVDGVTQVGIQSNRTDVTDAEGLPPHSFEAVVSGGLDQDIGDSIWDTQGAGIASFGNQSVSVIDSEGKTQTVYFSRPTPVYIWVKVKRDLYAEEDYPDDGDDLIKKAIVDWAALNQPIGKDVIRKRLSTPIYSVPGIGDIEILIDGTASTGDTPTYAAQDIIIAIRETAEFDESRIVVEDLTP